MPNKVQQRKRQWHRRQRSRKEGEDGGVNTKGLSPSAKEAAVREKWNQAIATFFEHRQKNLKGIPTMEMFSGSQRPYFGTTRPLPEMVGETDRELNGIKEEILLLKNDVLFGYLPKDLAVTKFQELKDRTATKSEQLQADFNEYFDLLENAEHIAERTELDRKYQMYLANYASKRSVLPWKSPEERVRLLKDMAGLVVLMHENRAEHRQLSFSTVEFLEEDVDQVEEDGIHNEEGRVEVVAEEMGGLAGEAWGGEEDGPFFREDNPRDQPQTLEKICVEWHVHNPELFEKTTHRKFVEPPDKAGKCREGKKDPEDKDADDKETKESEKAKRKKDEEDKISSAYGDSSVEGAEGVLSGDWVEDITDVDDKDIRTRNGEGDAATSLDLSVAPPASAPTKQVKVSVVDVAKGGVMKTEDDEEEEKKKKDATKKEAKEKEKARKKTKTLRFMRHLIEQRKKANRTSRIK